MQVLHTRADLGGSQILDGSSNDAGVRYGVIPLLCLCG